MTGSVGKASREKGKRGEREVRDILRANGVRARRDGRLDDDLEHGLDGFHLECKRRENLHLPAWIAQAEADAKGRIPVVVFRKSNQPWRAVLDFATLVRLITNQRETPDAETQIPSPSSTDPESNLGLHGKRCDQDDAGLGRMDLS